MAEGKEVQEKTQPKKSKLKSIILALLVIVLAAGGLMGWKIMERQNGEEAEISGLRTTDKNEKSVIYPLESFIVNLMDKAAFGKRYLKVTINLELGKEEDKKAVEGHVPQLRDATLLLLSAQTFRDINTIEGKLDLKHALLSKINQVLGEPVVQRVYFTEFVVQ